MSYASHLQLENINQVLENQTQNIIQDNNKLIINNFRSGDQLNKFNFTLRTDIN